MNGKYNVLEELSDFLGGTFHQDMGSPEKDLEEFNFRSKRVFTAIYSRVGSGTFPFILNWEGGVAEWLLLLTY